MNKGKDSCCSKRMGHEGWTKVVDDGMGREREGYRLLNALKLLMELATGRYTDKQQSTSGRDVSVFLSFPFPFSFLFNHPKAELASFANTL